jgi:hypothetical protein
MFQVTYSKAISISKFDEPVIDNVHSAYHAVTLEDEEKEYHATEQVMFFALMLPNRDKKDTFASIFWTRISDSAEWTCSGVSYNDSANTECNI